MIIAASVAGRLRRMGFVVEELLHGAKFDLLVNGEVRVALRVAFAGGHPHTVTVKDRRDARDVSTWTFGLHRHGPWDEPFCDVFVCVARQSQVADEYFVIPASVITGPTFSLYGDGHTYRGRYAPYRNAWGLLSSTVGQMVPHREVA